ncbi:MAG: hypothetical protein PGN11_08435 [Quadrisphaera sp.]
MLDVEQLRVALNSLVDLAVERFGPTVDVSASHSLADCYWHLPVEPAKTMADAPGQHLGVGQLSDDLVELAAMVRDPQGQVLWHSATHLSELLRLLAFLDLD